MLRRLHHEQPESFAFTAANLKWAEAQIAKYPEGRQASAVIPLLWRAQEQSGWVSRPVIETVAKMLGMAEIRVLEVATFYFMFQMKPVGSVAHFQICGTTSCMICGAEDLVEVCKDKIAPTPHTLSADGKFSWEEVECLGACSNAPMAQIGKDYYEDLTAERFAGIIDEFAAGGVPTPGPQNGRFASEPNGGLTSLKFPDEAEMAENASKELARVLADTNAKITDGRGICRPVGDPAQDPMGEAVAAETPDTPPHEEDVEPEKIGRPAPEPAATPAAGGAEGGGHWTSAIVADSGRASPNRGQTAMAPTAPLAEEATLRDGVGTWKYRATDGATGGGDAPDSPLEPAYAPKPDADDAGEAEPLTLSAPREGGADDLKRINGVGPKLEQTLNEMGFYHFDQIAAWTPAEVAWVDSRLKFKGRIERDEWIAQAAELAKGGE